MMNKSKMSIGSGNKEGDEHKPTFSYYKNHTYPICFSWYELGSYMTTLSDLETRHKILIFGVKSEYGYSECSLSQDYE
jgi:hypothetical protein